MTGTEKVNEYTVKLEQSLKAEIEVLKEVILGSGERITERVKWNALSFYFKDDFATFKLRSLTSVQTVFHRGVKVKFDIDDPNGLLNWVGQDRCVTTFFTTQTVEAEEGALVAIVKQWLGPM